MIFEVLTACYGKQLPEHYEKMYKYQNGIHIRFDNSTNKYLTPTLALGVGTGGRVLELVDGSWGRTLRSDY